MLNPKCYVSAISRDIYIFKFVEKRNRKGKYLVKLQNVLNWNKLLQNKKEIKKTKKSNLFNSLKFWTHCGVVTSHGYNIKCSPCSHALPIVEATKRGLPWVWEPITGPLDLTDVLTIKNTIQIQLIRLTKNENIL